MTKTRGQKNLLSGAYTQMNHLIGRLEGPTSYYCHLKETWLNAWSVLTSSPPIMKRNTKH